ncbi:MAG: amidohydrolase [Lachnospiraceae bacterium]|nr:amidohydrolase [Lachnospiraceae bacterium]
MKIKFKNANVLDKNFDVLENQDLIVEGNRIKKIQNTVKDDNATYDRVIDCDGNYLIPGIKNAHTHNAMVFLRSLSDDLPLGEWLTKYCFPNEAKLTYEDIYYFTILGIMENLSSGVVGSMDMYLDLHAMADASLKTGFRVCICDTIQKFNKIISPEEYFIELNNYKGDNGNLVKYVYGMHAEYTNTEEIIKMLSDLVHKYKVPFFVHNSETKKEVDECKERWGGLTPTQVFEKFGLYDFGGGGYHSIYLDDKDMEIYKKHDIIAVTCPGSNVKLASGIAPILKYKDYGIKVAIGTDGPASNNAIDMFREMYLTTTLQKVSNSDPAVLNAKEILNMVMINGAKCIGHSDGDVIDEGKLADIVMIDVHKPNMQPLNTFVNNLVYSASKTNVKLTMVDGKILYEDGKYFINEDENYIYKKCNELLKNLLNR